MQPSAEPIGVDRGRVAAFAEVGNRLEQRHSSYSRSVKEYYDRRAPEYDEWYLGIGRFAERDRPAWEEELEQLFATLAALPPGRTLESPAAPGS